MKRLLAQTSQRGLAIRAAPRLPERPRHRVSPRLRWTRRRPWCYRCLDMGPSRVLADRFEIGELVGIGGMGSVHRSRDHATGESVAIKLLRHGGLSDIARFEREVSAL